MRRTWLIHLFFACCCAAPARAQWRLNADVGASRLKQAGLPEATASTIGATLDVAGQFAAFRTSALGSHASGDRWTGQWLGIGSVLTPAWKGVRLNLSGALSAFGQSNERPTTSADVLAQAQIGDARRAFAVGGGTGSTAHAGTAGRFDRAIGNAWWSFGAERITAEVALTRTPAVFGTAALQAFGPGQVLWTGTQSAAAQSVAAANYIDVAGNWLHQANGWSTNLVVGARRRTNTSGIATYQQADATLWIAPRVGVTLAAGRTLEDLVRGVPRTRYLAAGLRIATVPHLTITRRRAAAGPRMTAARLADGQQRIEVRAPAERVELMGDFTNWAPVALEREGDVWRLDAHVAPGPHRVAIRIDGGAWIVPVNLPHVEDDFGGVVGIITIP
jgi:hypothetical protein